MNRYALVRNIGLLALIACAQVCLLPSDAWAEVIMLAPVAANTAVDSGPMDGVYELFPLNFASVNNNGWSSIRTSYEFDISAIPPGSTINSATLRLPVGWIEGSRQLALHGYVGDGSITVADFSRDQLIGSTGVDHSNSSSMLPFSASSFISSLVAGGAVYAGFNVREDPFNVANYTVIGLGEAPWLEIDFTPPTSGKTVNDVLMRGTVAVVDAPELRLRLTAKVKLRSPAAGRLEGLGATTVLPVVDPRQKQVSWLALAGSVAGDVVTLNGTVIYAADPALLGAAVTIRADRRSGAITLYFGELVLQGIGQVVFQELPTP